MARAEQAAVEVETKERPDVNLGSNETLNFLDLMKESNNAGTTRMASLESEGKKTDSKDPVSGPKEIGAPNERETQKEKSSAAELDADFEGVEDLPTGDLLLRQDGKESVISPDGSVTVEVNTADGSSVVKGDIQDIRVDADGVSTVRFKSGATVSYDSSGIREVTRDGVGIGFFDVKLGVGEHAGKESGGKAKGPGASGEPEPGKGQKPQPSHGGNPNTQPRAVGDPPAPPTPPLVPNKPGKPKF